MKIQEVMTHDVSFVTPDTPVTEIARRMRDEDIGAVPVVENDRMIGMVTDCDIAVRCVASGNMEGATALLAAASLIPRAEPQRTRAACRCRAKSP